tara:strand:- start:100 stop:1416 length:1317 start_codon:yes stop_codon:yes gene_type:complete
METAAVSIVKKLQKAGHEAFFAGGCVRDRLRGAIPNDIDIATSARPQEILQLYPHGNTIGAHFGVILIKQDGHLFEIATFREDGDYEDGRRPESVTFSTAKCDASRRDFTINGIFFDPLSEKLIDYVSGEQDLKSQLIRSIGTPSERFGEDYLRLLRAIRFATSLEFEIEAETWEAIKTGAENISKITPERIQEELDKIWRSPHRVRGFDLLVESGLMKAILPEIIELQGCEQPPQWHPEGDVFVHTRLMLKLLPADASLELVMSVLFHDIGKPSTFTQDDADGRIRFNGHDKLGAQMAEGILNRLRYSNAITDAVVSGVANHMAFKDVQQMRTSKLKRFMAKEHFAMELELHRTDCAGSNGILENYHFLKEKEQEFAKEPLIPPPLITGKHLIDRGLKPGPDFKILLTRAQDLQLEGTLKSESEALEWLEGELSSPQ